jgi:hypothetical protein
MGHKFARITPQAVVWNVLYALEYKLFVDSLQFRCLRENSRILSMWFRCSVRAFPRKERMRLNTTEIHSTVSANSSSSGLE